ncbi:MAG: hypothetical protein CMG11_04005 [Candidatus Marinimicrobia bacterium]|nr:hypothetical protein [Candidatus Neomarinimicrobiota bacterium]
MQNLTKETINATGFDLIKSKLSTLSNCDINIEYFKRLMPVKTLVELTEHLILSDKIYQLIIKENDVDIIKLSNLTNIILKLNIKGSYLSENEFEKLYNLLKVNLKIEKILSHFNIKIWKKLQKAKSNKKWIKLIEEKLDESFNIKSNASKKLLKLHKQKKLIEKNIDIKMNEHYENAKKKNWLQNENISWINERSVLPFKVSLKNKIQGIVHQHSASGKTAFIEPIEIVKLNNAKNQNEFDIYVEKKKILIELTICFNKIYTKIESINSFVNKYDRHLAIAKYAYQTNSIKPTFINDNTIKIKNSINPLIKDHTEPIPLNFEMSRNTDICIISGPNTGGKTVVLKSIGLYAIMAQCGIFIPADYFQIPFFDNVLSDIGDNQSIESGLSTFSSHMMNIKNIIDFTTSKSLILLDEIGTGTDPNSSMAIAQSILEEFSTKKMKLITTTHLINLKDWAARTKNVENAMMKFNKKNYSPTYEFLSGSPGSSYAIEILEKMKFEDKIVNRAKSLIGSETIKLDKLIDNIEKKESETELNNQRIKLKLKQLELESKKISNKEDKLNEKILEMEHNWGLDSYKYLNDVKKKIEKIIEKIRTENASKESIKNAQDTINKELTKSSEKINLKNKKSAISIQKNEIKIGKEFLVKSLNLTGFVESDLGTDDKLFLNISGKRIKVHYSDLCKAQKDKKKQNNKLHSKFEISNISSNKIDLRGLNVEDATFELDKFIDSAYMNNLVNIKIIHGTGTGALQKGIHSYLKKHKNIKKFNFAPLENGGYGATEITLF